MSNIVFTEKQKFSVIWIIVVFLCTIPLYIIFISGLHQQLIKGKPFGDHPMSDQGLLVFSVVMMLFLLGVVILFASCRLDTRYSREGIEYRLFPFHLRLRLIRWGEIEKAWVREYRPVIEYRGWGLRYSFKNGRAYNISGRWGVHLALKNGKRVLIGTKEPAKLEEIIRQLSGG